jgi:uncharacterized membrane protein
MTGPELVSAAVLFAHDLFTVLWIGGMIAVAVGLVPAARKILDRGHMMRLMAGVQSRLRWFVYVAMVVLVVTGILLARRSPGFSGFFAWNDAYSIALSLKHTLIVGMVGIALVRSLALSPPAGAPAGSAPGGPPGLRMRAGAALLAVNIALGCGVLFLSAVTAVV